MGKWRYAVVADAGSSGTRIYVYKWKNPARAREDASNDELKTLPVIKTHNKWTKKISPGVSTLNETPEEAGRYLQPLIEHALKYIPNSEIEHTPFFLAATAGMRMLPQHEQDDLLASICKYIKSETPLQVGECNKHIEVVPGLTEGLYGWLASNYLLGGFDHPSEHDHGDGHNTYGFLDMGGASAQIAFAPNSTEAEKHADDLTLVRLRTIDGNPQEHRIFVTTWLGFGANEARHRYVDALKLAVGGDGKVLPDPCLPSGLEATLSGKLIQSGSPEANSNEQRLLGTGKFDECLRQTYPLLEKNKPCADPPCLIGGTHVPAIDFDVNHFVGVSEYWHMTHSIFEMEKGGKSFDMSTYQNRVMEFCGQPWEDIAASVEKHKWGKKVDVKKAQETCFKASWVINMLYEGIGVPRVGLEMDPLSGEHRNETTKQLIDAAKEKGFLSAITPVDEIKNTEVSWTLGKMVLYASSQIPALDEGFPVGYGRNVPGQAIPFDFQLPGGSNLTLPNDLTDAGAQDDTDMAVDEADWHDTLFKDTPKRIPGLVLFLLIIIVLIYLFVGRDRRAAWSGKARRIFGSSKGTSTHRGKYNRVLVEDPEAAGEFELGDGYGSDGSDASEVTGLGIRSAGGLTSRTESRSASPGKGFRRQKDAMD